jgi:hypothetical protein
VRAENAPPIISKTAVAGSGTALVAVTAKPLNSVVVKLKTPWLS